MTNAFELGGRVVVRREAGELGRKNQTDIKSFMPAWKILQGASYQVVVLQAALKQTWNSVQLK